jgi:hypothetical protein
MNTHGGRRPGSGRTWVIATRNRDAGRLKINDRWVSVTVRIARREGYQVQYWSDGKLVAVYAPAREMKARAGKTSRGGDATPCPLCGRPEHDHLSACQEESAN